MGHIGIGIEAFPSLMALESELNRLLIFQLESEYIRYWLKQEHRMSAGII